MSNDTDDLNGAIDLGAEVAVFLQGRVGVLLTAKAEAEEREALEALAIVDASDAKAIRELQNQAWRANSFMGWLKEAIEAAVAAHRDQQGQETLPEPPP